MNCITKVTTKRSYSITLTGCDIISLLRNVMDSSQPMPSTSATVTFRVPSGGDYSGMNIGVDVDCPITIAWEIIG